MAIYAQRNGMMAARKKVAEDQAKLATRALVDDILEASDEEILAEAVEDGVDIAAVVAKGKELLDRAVRATATYNKVGECEFCDRRRMADRAKVAKLRERKKESGA